jgi:hypothetical protein
MEGNAMKLLILKEKHGDRHFSFNTEAELHLVARFIVSERIDEDCYIDEQNNKILGNLNKVTLYNDGAAALRVLDARSDWEYEGYEIIETESIEGAAR